ncbi:MAG: hypothetical protein N2C12_07570, partial [Planctomycetales bacterium]
MVPDFQTFILFAQNVAQNVVVDGEQLKWYQEWYGVLLVLIMIFAIPLVVGRMIANGVRMRDYGWKISVILFSGLAAGVLLATSDWNLGVDLDGGTIVEFEVDQSKKNEIAAAQDSKLLMNKIVNAARQRLDPSGVMQLGIRVSGDERIEITIPGVGKDEVDQLIRMLVAQGNLEFRILADKEFDKSIVQRAKASPERSVKDKDEPALQSEVTHQPWIVRAEDSDSKQVKHNDLVRAI